MLKPSKESMAAIIAIVDIIEHAEEYKLINEMPKKYEPVIRRAIELGMKLERMKQKGGYDEYN